MASNTGRPVRQTYPAGRMGWQQWKADHDAWTQANKQAGLTTSADMRQTNDPKVPQNGQAIALPDTAGLKTPPENMARMQPHAPFAPNTAEMARTTPGLGMGKNMTPKPAAPATTAPAGIVADPTPAAPAPSTSTGKPSWWNPNDDYTPDGGPDWGGGDVQADHPEWWGEIKNFAPDHQTAMARAYKAGDEAAFQQIRDRARADLYGGRAQAAATPTTPTSDSTRGDVRQSNDPHRDPITIMPSWMDHLPDSVRLDAQNDWAKLLTRK